ncbi:MAG: TlpA disulfide reductase family protein [Anaerolineales bacterium]|jgi:peroxiredoxin
MSHRTALPFFVLGFGLMLLGTGLGIWLLSSQSEGNTVSPTTTRSCVQPAPVSFEAPQLELETLEGRSFRLEDYRGSTVLLNAWATWCPPCIAELPDLEAYYKQHKDEGFTIIGVNIGEPVSVVEKFLASNAISYPIWLDPHEQTLRSLNTISLPYSILVDQDGHVRLAWSGATCLEKLEAAVTPILRQ